MRSTRCQMRSTRCQMHPTRCQLPCVQLRYPLVRMSRDALNSLLVAFARRRQKCAFARSWNLHAQGPSSEKMLLRDGGVANHDRWLAHVAARPRVYSSAARCLGSSIAALSMCSIACATGFRDYIMQQYIGVKSARLGGPHLHRTHWL